MSKNRQWLLRLFIILFSISVSATILPCGIMVVHGLFGEVKTSVVTEDRGAADEEVAAKQILKTRRIKGSNIFNAWFEIVEVIVYMAFVTYVIRLPRGHTIITLKVRMDD